MTEQLEKIARRICVEEDLVFLSLEYYSSSKTPLWIAVEEPISNGDRFEIKRSLKGVING